MYSVTIKHAQFEGGEDHWTVPFRPYLEPVKGEEDLIFLVFFDRDPIKEADEAKVLDWIVLPKQGFGYIRSTLLQQTPE